MPKEFTIQPGSAVKVDWKPEEQAGVTPIDVVVFHPNKNGKVFIGEHSQYIDEDEDVDVEIISAVAEVLPALITGLVDGILYTKEEVFGFIRNGRNVSIDNPVPGADSTAASSWLSMGLEENAVSTVTVNTEE